MCSYCEHFARVPLIGGLSWGGCVNDVVLVFVEVSGFPEEVPATLVVDSVLVLVHALTVYTHLKAKPKLGYQTPDCVEVGGLQSGVYAKMQHERTYLHENFFNLPKFDDEHHVL